MRRSTLATLAILLAAGAAGGGALGGCARATTEAEASDAPAMLIVDNASSIDMDVFMLGGTGRVRLGLAPGGRTTRFQIADPAAAGAGLVFFQAVPISGRGRSVATDEAPVRRGDEITLRIPPQ